jgi:hypothetical protein
MVLLRRLALPLVCLALAAVVGLVAIADHRRKATRLNRVEIAEWYCAHHGTRCGGASSARIEARWNARQRVYEAVVAGLGATALVVGGRRLRRSLP